jgi:predicted membrane channel-forming protein YqfA (hemolysin III family)
MREAPSRIRPAEKAEDMTRTTWLDSLTRPWGHLVGTIVVTALVVAGGIIASMDPQWQPSLILITGALFFLWMLVMSVVYYRRQSGERADTSMGENV